MENFNLKSVLVEWSYRTDRGYPRVEKPEDQQILKGILVERYGEDFANEYLRNIQESINEIALGLNNSSLRHKNQYDKYNKRLIKIFKKGGKVEIETTTEYPNEADDDSGKLTIPEGAMVKVDSQDDIIGKLVAHLRKMIKHGPDFPEDSEEAQKALQKVESFFTHDDGTYRRIIPVKYKGNKILIKLNDISKNTVTDEEEEEEGEEGEKESNDSAEKQKKKKIKKKKQQQKKQGSDEEQVSEDSSESDSDFEAPDVTEFFGDSYNDGPENPDVMKEDSEDEDETGEGHHDDAPSKYVDRRKDGKDKKYPDREYREFDPESGEDEEEGGEAEEGGEEVEESFKFSFDT